MECQNTECQIVKSHFYGIAWNFIASYTSWNDISHRDDWEHHRRACCCYCCCLLSPRHQWTLCRIRLGDVSERTIREGLDWDQLPWLWCQQYNIQDIYMIYWYIIKWLRFCAFLWGEFWSSSVWTYTCICRLGVTFASRASGENYN